MPLLEATRAVDEGRVFLDGKPYAWEPDEMVLWLREHPEERGEVALERERARFTLGLPPPPVPPDPTPLRVRSPGRRRRSCHPPKRQRPVKIPPVAVFDRVERAPSGWRDALLSHTTRTGMEALMRIRLGIAALAAATLLAPTAGHASELEVYSNTQLNVQIAVARRGDHQRRPALRVPDPHRA